MFYTGTNNNKCKAVLVRDVIVPGASEIKGMMKRQERYFKPIIMSLGFCGDNGGSTPLANSGSTVILAKKRREYHVEE